MERLDTNQEQEVLLDLAKARVKKRKEFYIQFHCYPKVQNKKYLRIPYF